MATRRYHILILREDGKQYHNRILEWFQLRRHLTGALGTLALLLLGNVGFFVLAGWQGSLVARTAVLKAEKAKLQESFTSLTRTLDDAQNRLTDSSRKLAQMEELARQQNLRLPEVAGAGGPGASSPHALPEFSDPVAGPVAGRILDLQAQSLEVSQATEELRDILQPHLDSLAHTPSIWPVKGFLASSFGERSDPIGGEAEYHQGLDISAPQGSPVVAPAEGLVLETGWQQGYGNCIIVGHGNGLTTLYGHLSKVLVKPGQHVKRWDRLGLVGATGRATGPHLHYEVHRDGRSVNPRRYLLF